MPYLLNLTSFDIRKTYWLYPPAILRRRSVSRNLTQLGPTCSVPSRFRLRRPCRHCAIYRSSTSRSHLHHLAQLPPRAHHKGCSCFRSTLITCIPERESSLINL